MCFCFCFYLGLLCLVCLFVWKLLGWLFSRFGCCIYYFLVCWCWCIACCCYLQVLLGFCFVFHSVCFAFGLFVFLEFHRITGRTIRKVVLVLGLVMFWFHFGCAISFSLLCLWDFAWLQFPLFCLLFSFLWVGFALAHCILGCFYCSFILYKLIFYMNLLLMG